MLVELHEVSKGRAGQALPATSLAFGEGAALALAETQQRPTVLGLIATGRMRPDAGSVRIEGRTDAAALRRLVALVDAPGVSDPAPDVSVLGVTAEELMFAGIPSTPAAIRDWITTCGYDDIASTPIADVQPSRRIRLLLELASLRVGVQGMVLVSPDRHGGDPEHWWEVVEEFAARGFGVLAIAGAASASVLRERAPRADLPAAGPAEESRVPQSSQNTTPDPEDAQPVTTEAIEPTPPHAQSSQNATPDTAEEDGR